MKKEIRKEIREYILNQVNQTLGRLGISEDVKETTVYEGRYNDKLQYEFRSAPIKQMPVMFETLVVNGYMTVVEQKEDDRLYEWSKENDIVVVNLIYSYHHFGGGSNGCDIGQMTFSVSKELPKEFKKSPLHSDSRYYYVRKIDGLTI